MMQLKRIGRGVVVGAMVVVVGAVGCRFGRRCRRNVANDNNAINLKEF
jgi:predicted phage tail protein